jgi:hypothetical protein
MLRAIGYGLLAGLIFACLSQLSGCSVRTTVTQEETQELEFQRTQPDEYGVVCYSKGFTSSPISCVQVQEGRK